MKKLFFIIVILLTGCEDSENITKVKSLVYPQLDKTITIGNYKKGRKFLIYSIRSWVKYS